MNLNFRLCQTIQIWFQTSSFVFQGRKFIVPGVARFVVKKKAARKARMGRNPFNGEQMMFKVRLQCVSVWIPIDLKILNFKINSTFVVFQAKPASKVVKAYVVKAFKTL